MTCQHCVNRVMDAVNSIDGASGLVHLKKGIVTVSMAHPVEDAVICRAIEKAGYTVPGAKNCAGSRPFFRPECRPIGRSLNPFSRCVQPGALFRKIPPVLQEARSNMLRASCSCMDVKQTAEWDSPFYVSHFCSAQQPQVCV